MLPGYWLGTGGPPCPNVSRPAPGPLAPELAFGGVLQFVGDALACPANVAPLLPRPSLSLF